MNSKPDGRLELKVWDLQTGKELHVFQIKNGPSMGTDSVAFSLDGERIVLKRSTSGGIGGLSPKGSERVPLPPGIPRPTTPRAPQKPNSRPEGAPPQRVTNQSLRPPVLPPGPGGRRPNFDSGVRHIPSQAQITVLDARTGTEITGEAIPKTVPVLTVSPDRNLLITGLQPGPLQNPFQLKRLRPNAEQRQYRARHTKPNVARYVEGYLKAKATKDDVAIEFFRKLILEQEGPLKGKFRIGRADIDALATRAKERLQTGERKEAVPLLVSVVDWMQANLGWQDRDTLEAMSQLGTTYRELGQFEESAKLFKQLVSIHEKRHGREYPLTIDAIRSLGLNYKESGRYQEAIPLLEEAERATMRVPFRLRLHNTTVLPTLFDAYARVGDTEKIEQSLEELRKIDKASPEFARHELLAGLAAAGPVLVRHQKWPEAQRMLREYLTIRPNGGIPNPDTFYMQSLLGSAYLGQKQFVQAEENLLTGYDGMKRTYAVFKTANREDLIRIPEALGRLVQLYQQWKKPDETAKWQKELDAVDKPAGSVLPKS